MVIPARLFLLSILIATLNAEPESGISAAALKDQLIASAKADMEKAGENDLRISSSISRFIETLQKFHADESHRDAELQRLAMYLPDGAVSDEPYRFPAVLEVPAGK